MQISSILKLGIRGLNIMLFHRKAPIIGSIILTDRCNLSCKHCDVNNITKILYPYDSIQSEMKSLYKQGVRILIFYGGEPLLWHDKGRNVRTLVKDAKEMGFEFVNVVTNGTFELDIPEADVILVSIDGSREKHNDIRGETYDGIIMNILNASAPNVCIYMAINRINMDDIEKVTKLTASMDNVKAISFNFHTPYPGTEHLELSKEEKEKCANRIGKLMDEGYPILNLRTAFPSIIHNDYKTPCYQCVVVESGKQWVCGRCVDIGGLCDKCGFFFPAEYTLVFKGDLKAIAEMIWKYLRYI